jgi:hypothetical protein
MGCTTVFHNKPSSVGHDSTYRTSDLSAYSIQGHRHQPLVKHHDHFLVRPLAAPPAVCICSPSFLLHTDQPLPHLKMSPGRPRAAAPPAELKRGPGRKRKYATDADRRRAYALARRLKDEKNGRVYMRPYESREWRVKPPSPDRDALQRDQVLWKVVHPNYVSPLLWRWRDRFDGSRTFFYDATNCMVAMRETRQ